MRTTLVLALALTVGCRDPEAEDTADDTNSVDQTDADGDGVSDDDDAFPNDPDETTDTDNDGVGDNSDAFPNDPNESADTDNDGVGDNADAFPEDPAETTDTDADGTGDNSDVFPSDPAEWADTDADTIGDNADNCVDVANDDQANLDGDDLGDVCDDDRDGDGTDNPDDAFPDDASETTDTDGDGTGDNTDAFPTDETEWADDDGDGVGNNGDNCVVVANADQSDSDEDGSGDLCDGDRDGDGVGDEDDAFPSDPTETTDSDSDGVGDNADVFPSDPAEWADTDADGVGDNGDNCADTANADQANLDSDDLGDVCDDDRDGDGTNNSDDAFPDDPAETADTDSDGVGDNTDVFPSDPSEWSDGDSDGVGDNGDNCADTSNADQANIDGDDLGDLCDDDRDGDGVDNNGDAFPDDGTETTDTDADGVGDNADVCPDIEDANQADLDGDGTGDACDDDRDGDGYISDELGGDDCDDGDDTVTAISGCRPEIDPSEESASPEQLFANQPNGLTDLLFLPDGRAVACTIISGLDKVWTFKKDGTVEFINGVSSHNMGSVAASPNDGTLVVSYTNVATIGWYSTANNNFPVTASGKAANSPYYTKTYVKQAATSIAVDHNDLAWVPNFAGGGTLQSVAKDGTKGASINLGAYVESVAIDANGDLHATVGKEVRIVDRDGGTADTWITLDDNILDIVFDYNNVMYAELVDQTIVRVDLDGNASTFQSGLAGQGKLAISPDGRLHRIIPNPVSKAQFEAYVLPD